MSSIGSRIDERMEVVGISQAQLAREVGITAVSMMRIRTGQATNVRATTALQLAKSLKCRLEWLILGKGPVTEDQPIEHTGSATTIAPDPSSENGYSLSAKTGSPIDGDNLLAYTFSDDMLDLPNNCTAIIDTESGLNSGDYALFLTGEKSLLVRKYRDMGSAQFLEATANNIPEQFRFTEFKEPMKIIGKVIAYSVTL